MYVLPGRLCLERAVTRRCREPLAVFTDYAVFGLTGLALGSLSEHGRGTLPRFTVEVKHLHTSTMSAPCIEVLHQSKGLCDLLVLQTNLFREVNDLSEHGRSILAPCHASPSVAKHLHTLSISALCLEVLHHVVSHRLVLSFENFASF